MRKCLFGIVLVAIASSGCSGDEGGSGGSGTGATGGTGSGSSLELDSETALPAMSVASSAVAFSGELGNTFAAVFQAVGATPVSSPLGATPKVNVPIVGACPGGGSVTVDVEGGLVVDAVITIDLVDCVGLGVAAVSVSGRATATITEINNTFNLFKAATVFEGDGLMLDGETVVTGAFLTTVDLARFGQVIIRLGDRLDDDALTASENGVPVIRLGCFEISLVFELTPSLRLLRVGPVTVASAPDPETTQRVFTIGDYAASINREVTFDAEGLPRSGGLALFGGDHSGLDSDRGPSCQDFGAAPNESSADATFSEGGCAAVTGVDRNGSPFELASNYEKLVNGDLTPGGGVECGGGGPGVTCDEVPSDRSVVEHTDSDFPDSNWETEITFTEGAIVDAPSGRVTGLGVDGSAFRQMTHTIGDATNCAESCSLGVVHKFATRYDPSEGAIDYINYQEAQRILVPAFQGAAVGWSFAVIQDGTRYNARPETPSFTNTSWTINALCQLRAEDFGPVDGPNPDFSSGGSEITFAYTRSNTNTSEVNVSENVHGIDDFKVVIVQQ